MHVVPYISINMLHRRLSKCSTVALSKSSTVSDYANAWTPSQIMLINHLNLNNTSH